MTISPSLITTSPLSTIESSIGDGVPPVFRGAPRKTGGIAKLGKIQTALLGSIDPVSTDASMPNADVFRSGRDFAAWLGLTPRQNSSGGKQSLGAITKQGNRYITKLLVLAATSLLNVLGRRKGALRDWIVGLLAKKPARLVTVALANKLARIIWAVKKTGESFRSEKFAKAQAAVEAVGL